MRCSRSFVLGGSKGFVCALLFLGCNGPPSTSDSGSSSSAGEPRGLGAAHQGSKKAGLAKVNGSTEPGSPAPLAAPSRLFRFGPGPESNKPSTTPAPDYPLRLTASDGTGLRLLSLKARGVVEEPLAFTELHLRFENPEARVREGRFQITLPPGASISRFAMKIGNRWQEGEVVERQAARQAYEDFLHRRQDPALLEVSAGNAFSARVFPIPPKSVKELIVSYSQELVRSDAPYRIPLLGLPEIGKVDVQVAVSKRSLGGSSSSLGGQSVRHEVVEVLKKNWIPNRDFEVALTHEAGRAGLRHKNLVVARVTPVVKAQPQSFGSLAVLVDSSASRALGFADQVRLVERLLRGLADGEGAGTSVLVAAFDQEVVEIYRGTAKGFTEKAARRLRDRRPMGASNLHQALDWVKRNASDKNTPGVERVLLVTDGVATTGAKDGALMDAVLGLKEAHVKRLDALVVGGIRNDTLLRRMVTAGLPRAGTVIDGKIPIENIARKLTLATYSGIQVSVPGAKWVWPKTLDGFQPGDQFLVYADLPEERPWRLSLSGAERRGEDRTLQAAERPLLERAWVGARISKLLHQRDTVARHDVDLVEALKNQVIQISVRHRVLSPFTALLVLETEADYRRFKIDRRALADILTVEGQRIGVLNRTDVSPALVESKTAKKGAFGEQKDKLDRRRRNGGARRMHTRDQARQAPSALPTPEEASPPPPSRPRPKPEVARTGRLGTEGAVQLNKVGLSAARGAGAGSTGSQGLVQEADAFSEPEAVRDDLEELREPPRSGARARRKAKRVTPHQGPFKVIKDLLKKRAKRKALEKAWAWRTRSPGDVLALIALGEVFEAQQEFSMAARAYGSLVDLFPSRADILRFAAARLERLNRPDALTLAKDILTQAVQQRPDHPSGHHMLAMVFLKLGQPKEAFGVLKKAVRRTYPSGRFRGVDQILKEDLGLAGAMWIHKSKEKRDEVLESLRGLGATLEDKPSLRFVLSWETDANDVDFHIYDRHKGHAFYRQKALPSGGNLYADVTTGYGPECFTIRKPRSKRAYPYRLQAHYYRRGPMGYGMGKLQIIDHDGHGRLSFEERPFVVMTDGAYLDMGKVTR